MVSLFDDYFLINIKYSHSDIAVLFANHGDTTMNTRVLRRLGYGEHEKAINRDFHVSSRHYVVVNMSANLESSELRVATNLFAEKTRHVLFY